MKVARQLVVLAVSIGTVLSPFCPMAAQAKTMRMSEPQVAVPMAHLDEAMPPCCAWHEEKDHSGDRVAAFSNDASVAIPFTSVARIQLPETTQPVLKPLAEEKQGKFESRSHIKRE